MDTPQDDLIALRQEMDRKNGSVKRFMWVIGLIVVLQSFGLGLLALRLTNPYRTLRAGRVELRQPDAKSGVTIEAAGAQNPSRITLYDDQGREMLRLDRMATWIDPLGHERIVIGTAGDKNRFEAMIALKSHAGEPLAEMRSSENEADHSTEGVVAARRGNASASLNARGGANGVEYLALNLANPEKRVAAEISGSGGDTDGIRIRRGDDQAILGACHLSKQPGGWQLFEQAGLMPAGSKPDATLEFPGLALVRGGKVIHAAPAVSLGRR